MPLSHVSKLYAVSDSKIAKVTADPAGGATTYGASTDVPGIKEMSIGGNVNTVELRGDNSLLDQNSTLGNITVSVTHAKLSLDVLAIMLGGTVTDSGTTPNQIASWLLKNTDAFSYFSLEGKTPTAGADTPTGDAHFKLHKCILTSFPDMGHAEEDYRIVSFEAVAVPLISNGNHITVTLNETAVAIA